MLLVNWGGVGGALAWDVTPVVPIPLGFCFFVVVVVVIVVLL